MSEFCAVIYTHLIKSALWFLISNAVFKLDSEERKKKTESSHTCLEQGLKGFALMISEDAPP